MTTHNHILVGTDFSRGSDAALHEAVRLARHHRARLTLMHVLDPPLADAAWATLPVSPAEVSAALEQRANRELESRLELGEGLAMDVQVAIGNADTELRRFADQNECGLIVVGARSQDPIERFVLGSSAERLMRHASQMVLVVRPDKRPGFQRILAPIDFSEHSRSALRTAIRIAADEGSELCVVHVYEFAGVTQVASLSSAEAMLGYQRELEERARKELDAWIREFDLRGIDPHVHLRVGVPRAEIVSCAQEIDADLIVMGSIGRTGVQALFIGNTAERVARNAPCSVLVVKPSAARA